MVPNCCTALAHALRLAHYFIPQSPYEWVAGDGNLFRPDVARRLWAQMLFQYLCDVQDELPKVQAHFMRGGPARFAAALREPCRIGFEESTSYHELTMQLALRMLSIVQGCIGATPVAVPRDDTGVLEELPCHGIPPDANISEQLARGFCKDNADIAVSAIADNFEPVRTAFANDRGFSRFGPRHWQRLVNMTQKEAALVPEAHTTTPRAEARSEGDEAAISATGPRATRPLATFISYSHKDQAHRERLDAHLAPLKRHGVLAIWHDQKIMPGEKWDSAIRDKLENADIILLLVSADFLASDFCHEREMRRAIERHQAAAASVISIIVEACQWQEEPLAKLQVLPKDGKPVATWNNREEAWLDVVAGIRRAADAASARKGH